MKEERKDDKKDFPYEDILFHPHHQSPRHPRMSLRDRAAQFAPFTALNGYDETLQETAARREVLENAFPGMEIEIC